MIRRHEYFARNVVPDLLLTLSDDYKNDFETTITYKSGDFTYRYLREWAKLPDELWGYVISGITTDKNDNLFITMKNKSAPIIKFDKDGNMIKSFGEKLPIAKLHGISVTDDGDVWVTDDNNHVAFLLNEDGDLIRMIGKLGVPSDSGYRQDYIAPDDNSKPIRIKVFDENGNEIEKIISNSAYKSIKRMAPPFNKPTKILRHRNEIYASDGYGNVAIHAFDLDGNLLRSFGAPGNKPGEFSIVHSIHIDKRDRIWAADRENDRVEIFTLGGELVGIIDGLWYPVDVWSDGDHAYILQNDGKISIYSLDFELEAEIGHWQSGNLTAHSITGDSLGNLYIADCGVKGVIKLERIKDKEVVH